MPTHYIVLRALENEHATCYDEAFHFPGTILEAAQLREESIPILLDAGVIAPCASGEYQPTYLGSVTLPEPTPYP